MTDRENAKWQDWETIGLIGRGSFGDVYEIKRDVFDDTEKAALKIISIPQNSSDIDEMYNDGYDEESITGTFESHLKSILAEYTLMRKMSDCVNIVRCDDVHYEHHEDGIGWNIYIRMELLTPLTKALPVVVPEETVIELAKDICTALDCCKKYNVIHRDIKPQNIFVSENGDYKLGDFGIAKTVEKTMGGTKIGTYKYMAPEVYNNQPYGTAADIYSLGLVLYWMLNNRRMPFVAANSSKMTVGIEEESRNRRLSGEMLPEPANGSKELKAIVMKACAYNPKDRYSSAKEMLDELNRLGKECEEADEIVTIPIIDSSIVEYAKENDSENDNTELNNVFVLPMEKVNKNKANILVEENDLTEVETEKSKLVTVTKGKLKKPLIISICAVVLAVLIFIGAIIIRDTYNSDSEEFFDGNVESHIDNSQDEVLQDTIMQDEVSQEESSIFNNEDDEFDYSDDMTSSNIQDTVENTTIERPSDNNAESDVLLEDTYVYLNNITQSASTGSYDVVCIAGYTEGGEPDFGSSTATLNNIIRSIDENASLDTVIGDCVGVDYHLDSVVEDGMYDDWMEPYALKSMTILEGDIVSEEDRVVILEDCINPKKDGNNPLHHVTNNFVTEAEIIEYFAMNYDISVSSVDLRYHNIIVQVEVIDDKIEISIFYEVSMTIKIKAGGITATGSCEYVNSMQYTVY